MQLWICTVKIFIQFQIRISLNLRSKIAFRFFFLRLSLLQLCSKESFSATWFSLGYSFHYFQSDPRHPLKWLFFPQAFLRTVGFIYMIEKEWLWRIHDHLMSESLPLGKLLPSLFVSLLSFELSNKMRSKICFREEFSRCKIHLELLRNLQMLCCKLWPSAPKCLPSCDHFF